MSGHEDLALVHGHLVLVPPGVPHGFAWDQQRASRHGFVRFDADRVGLRDVSQIRIRRMTPHDPLAGLCAYLIWLGRDQPDDWEHHVEQALRFLLARFVSGPLPGDDDGSVLSPPLLAVIDHLREEWLQMPLHRVGVGELASAARVSRGYLNRLFRMESGSASPRDSRASAVLVRRRS